MACGMPVRPGMGKMAGMSGRGAAGRAVAESQPDLFDERGLIEAGCDTASVAPMAPPDAASLSDAALIALLPQVTLSNVEALCSEVVSRDLVAAVPALEGLWRRFVGFGMRVPLVEQRAVLSALPRLECPCACSALRGIVLSKGLPASLLPLAMRAASEAALSLPAGFVGPLLQHEDATVRAASYALAPRAGVPVELLREGPSDPSPPVRRLAAIALGIAGDAAAVAPIVAELVREPSAEAEVIEALTMIGDEDAIVHLGRCAGNHPEFAGSVLDALHDMDSARAQRLVHHLEAGGRASEAEGA